MASSIKDYLKGKAKKIAEGLKDTVDIVDTTDILSNIEFVFIGDHSFNNQQLKDKFIDPNSTQKNDVVPLLKKVFQNKYPMTRNHGIPRVPANKEQKEFLLSILQYYFNEQRYNIIKKRKMNGNSVSMRELINHIQ